MKAYLFSFAVGLLVGAIYGMLNVRSPAPPMVALIGLLGILLGEQVVPIGRHLIAGAGLESAWVRAKSASHIFGALPGRHAAPLEQRAHSDNRGDAAS